MTTIANINVNGNMIPVEVELTDEQISNAVQGRTNFDEKTCINEFIRNLAESIVSHWLEGKSALNYEQMEELAGAVEDSFGHCEDFGLLAEPLGNYIAKDSLSDFIEDKYEEIINKPKWYEISVELQGTHTIYVKANSEDDAREAVLNYDVEFKDDIDLDDLDYSIDSIDEYYDEEPPHWSSHYDVTE